MSWLVDTWSLLKYWFTRRNYVANAYGDTIFVMVDSDRTHVCDASCKFKVSIADAEVSAKSDVLHKANSLGFTAIASRSETFFEPQSTGTVYITIYLVKRGKSVKLCEALPVNANRSVIVSKKGFVRNAEKDEIWIDQSGVNHNEWGEHEECSESEPEVECCEHCEK